MAAFLTASLVLCLLVFSSKVVAEGQRIITAEPGDNVILTCRAAENKEVIIVEWSRTDLKSDQYVLLYSDQFDPEGQSPSFRNRVDLLGVKNGDVSLVLKNVTTADTGTYECRVVQGENNHRKRSILKINPIRSIDLRVEAGQRNITAEPGDNVILTCRAAENKDVRVVEWSRTDLESDQYVLLYSDQFDPEFQSPSFRNRVDLLDVENGDVSLVLKNVTTDDGGTYECRVVQRGNNHRKRSILKINPIRSINLRVEAGNKEGQRKAGESKTGLIAGPLVCAVLVVLAAAAAAAVVVFIRRKQKNSSSRSEPPPAPEAVPLQVNPNP